MRKSVLSLAVLAALTAPTLTFADEAPAEAAAPAAAAAPAPDWTFPLSVSLVSDYIFRGQSQTWGRPAVQFSAEADHKSGFYAGFFASNVSDNWLPGASVETDFYAGFRNKIGETDFGYDVGGIYYVYPGANWNDSNWVGSNKSNSIDTFELYASLSYKWLSFKTGITTTDYWGWNKNNSAPASEPSNGGVGDFNGDANAGVKGSTKGSYFTEFNAAYEVAPTWTVSGQLGRQFINNSHGLDITYWKAGVTKGFDGGWTLGAFYSGTDEPDAYEDFLSLDNTHTDSDIARDTVFVTLTKAFSF